MSRVSGWMFPALVLLTPTLVGWGWGASGPTKLSPTLKNLVPLESRHGHYEMWVRTAEKDISAGKFSVRVGGALTGASGGAATFSVPVAPSTIQEVYLTQEPPNDIAPGPSKQVFLRGAFVDGQARLEPPFPPSLFRTATGVYLLDNPVTYKDPTDFNGLWFASYLTRRYKPGLKLPVAPQGWLYAGWVVLEGVPLRVGKFRSGEDNDDWQGYSGRSGATELIDPAGRPMPGEDFIQKVPAPLPSGRNLPNLSGGAVIVSLENAALAQEDLYPSPLHIFEAQIPMPAKQKVDYALKNVAERRFPTGTVKVE